MELHIETIKPLPIWVQLSDLDIKYWGVESLSKIGGILSIPLKTDRCIKEKSMLHFARLLIEMPLDSSFLDYIDFINDNDILVRQHVNYEWKLILCTHC